MTRKHATGSSPGDWAQFWDQAQQRAWDTWRRMAGQSASPPEPQPDTVWALWSQELQRFAQLNDERLSGTPHAVYDNLLQQGRGFLFLSHELLRVVERMQSNAEQARDWKRALRDAIDRAQAELRRGMGQPSGMPAAWGMAAPMWERLNAALSPATGGGADPLANLAALFAGVGNGTVDGVGPWSALGAEGASHVRQLVDKAQRYQTAWQDYASALMEVGVLALDHLYERLVAAGETGPRIGKLRAVYDLWVDAAEQAYAEAVATPQFAERQAAVINTAVDCRLALHDWLETAGRAQNLPTRSELDSAHQAIQELRDEVQSLRQQLSAETPRSRRGKRGDT